MRGILAQQILNVCKEDSLKRGIANPLIFALIDHRNKESLALFERNGFLDDGPDEDEPDRYRRFVRFGFGGQEAPRSNTRMHDLEIGAPETASVSGAPILLP